MKGKCWIQYPDVLFHFFVNNLIWWLWSVIGVINLIVSSIPGGRTVINQLGQDHPIPELGLCHTTLCFSGQNVQISPNIVPVISAPFLHLLLSPDLWWRHHQRSQPWWLASAGALDNSSLLRRSQRRRLAGSDCWRVDLRWETGAGGDLGVLRELAL